MFFNESTHAAVSPALWSAMFCKNFRKFEVACSKPTNIDEEACNNLLYQPARAILVGGFLRVLLFPPPIKLTATI